MRDTCLHCEYRTRCMQHFGENFIKDPPLGLITCPIYRSFKILDRADDDKIDKARKESLEGRFEYPRGS